jgi:hypothetical protein
MNLFPFREVTVMKLVEVLTISASDWEASDRSTNYQCKWLRGIW